MNYKRIYDEFIADRMQKQPGGDEYYEVHHIQPRCMGGGDVPSNLIRLSASDHLFAHQLLARAYRNTEHAYHLWGAVIVLCRDTVMGKRVGRGGKRLGAVAYRSPEGIRLRKSIDVARKDRIERFSGEDSPMADKTPYIFRNIDGRLFIGTRIAFCEEHRISNWSMSHLLSDREWHKTKCGWFVYDNSKTDEDRKIEGDPTKYIFRHENGHGKYRGTRRAFKKNTGMSWEGVHAIIDEGDSDSGWRVEQVIPAPPEKITQGREKRKILPPHSVRTSCG